MLAQIHMDMSFFLQQIAYFYNNRNFLFLDGYTKKFADLLILVGYYKNLSCVSRLGRDFQSTR